MAKVERNLKNGKKVFKLLFENRFDKKLVKENIMELTVTSVEALGDLISYLENENKIDLLSREEFFKSIEKIPSNYRTAYYLALVGVPIKDIPKVKVSDIDGRFLSYGGRTFTMAEDVTKAIYDAISDDQVYLVQRKNNLRELGDIPLSSTTLRGILSEYSEYINMSLKNVYILGIFTSVNTQLKVEKINEQMRKILLNRPVNYLRNGTKVSKSFSVLAGRMKHRFNVWNTLQVAKDLTLLNKDLNNK